jgi:hypothetical protein
VRASRASSRRRGRRRAWKPIPTPRDGAGPAVFPPTAAGLLRRACHAGAALGARDAALVGSAIVLVAGVFLAGALNVWVDEAFTLHTTAAGPLFAWAQAVAFEAQPPLYFVLEAVWRTSDETSVGFARLPSVLFAAAAVALIVGAAARVTPRTPPLAVALATALNPIVLWAAVEMRVYALVLLVGAALTWAFFEGFLVEHPSRRARVWYTLFAVAGLYTQYYVGFVLAAHCLTLLILRRGMLRAFAGPLAFAAVAFAPFAGIALVHVGASGAMVERVSLARAAHQIANAVFVYVLPHEITWSGAPKFIGFAAAALVIGALALGGRPAIGPGPARALAPTSMLVAYLLIASVTRRRALAAGLAAFAFAAFSAAQLWSAYHPPAAKRGEWQRVASILKESDPSIPVAVFPAELALPLDVYSTHTTIAIPRPMPFTLDYVSATTLRSQADVARVLDPVRLRTDRLWLVTQTVCRDLMPDAYDYHCGILENYMEHYYRVTRNADFRGAEARLYVRK